MLRVMGVIAPPKSAGLPRRIGGILLCSWSSCCCSCSAGPSCKLIALPFGGIGNTAWFYGFLLIVVVLGVLAVFGRRRQRTARGRKPRGTARRGVRRQAVAHISGSTRVATGVLPPFWTLVETHGDELLVHARRLAGDEHAEDVLQDALLRALRAYPRLRHADHLRAWLYRVTTSAAMDHHRSRRREVVDRRAAGPAHPRCVRRRRLREPDRTAQRDRSHRPAAALRRRPRLRRDRDAARLLDRRRPPARLDRRPHPPGELRMTPLPESLLESVAAAAVREGLADALFTRLKTPLGTLLVVQGPDGPRPDRLRGRARGRRPGRGRRRAGPERDRLRPRAGRASATRCPATSRATRRRSTCRSTCG